ncbi:MAG: AAA family ATPase [Candidatus Omnitrophica bacterium]|nr:AAA family ATPase [Candidatus Omnitrophota bacterium]
MSYYNILGLDREPFSTSPDPKFLYHSTSHHTVLKRLEIAIRLRRGLSIILGDIGTGKTTLSRALLQAFKDEPDFIFHLILDPGFKSEYQFLLSLVKMFDITPNFNSTIDFKEAIEKYLFQKGVEENKTIILLIDEGQKINFENLEALRTLLNFETNEFKLLQLVIMAQVELLPRVSRIRNFTDRVALKYTINPLDEIETKEMIEFRLKQAGFSGSQAIFSDGAIKSIYQFTQGYPRKISMLCHDALETIVMKGAAQVSEEIIESLTRERVSA